MRRVEWIPQPLWRLRDDGPAAGSVPRVRKGLSPPGPRSVDALAGRFAQRARAGALWARRARVVVRVLLRDPRLRGFLKTPFPLPEFRVARPQSPAVAGVTPITWCSAVCGGLRPNSRETLARHESMIS